MSSHKQTMEHNAAVKNGTGRMCFALLAILLEVLFILWVVLKMNQNAAWISMGTRVLTVLLVLGIYSQHKTSTMKTPWIILILTAPVLGCTLFLLIGLNGSTRKMAKRFEDIGKVLFPYLEENGAAEKAVSAQAALEEQLPAVAGITQYIHSYSHYPLYQNTDVTYYDDAAKGLEAQKEALQKAEQFIFMEYHAIEDGEAFHGILDILEERAKAGVEVRVFYDDMGSIGFINTDFVKRLKEKGIRCRVFNPFAPGCNLFLNNRDHRKITVIDGKVGFTGGYNLANEYFHLTQPYGFWKDTGIKLTGEAVRSLTVTFLEMWNAVKENDLNDTDMAKYLLQIPYTSAEQGFVAPYADNPMDDENVGENVYISLAEHAQKYVWFITPYLILTDEMIHAFGLAAKRGVDVRVITPGIPDKKIVYGVTRSYYNTLTRNGVKLYEYTPGFCHAKMCVMDGIAATCGTINLDYRSLYHHFENGCLYSSCKAVQDTKEDFEQMFPVCRDVTEYYTSGRGRFMRIKDLILRLFAPLM